MPRFQLRQAPSEAADLLLVRFDVPVLSLLEVGERLLSQGVLPHEHLHLPESVPIKCLEIVPDYALLSVS